MRTYTPKPADITREWLVIDATDVRLGRLAVQVANLLRGKHKAMFANHVDTGDFVIVINAAKVSLSSNKAATKMAYRHSGTPGGLRAGLAHDFGHGDEGLDRPGLLSEITATISALNLDIASAHVTTFGEKVIDSFYVTDLTGAKIISQTRINAIIKRLTALFVQAQVSAA